MNSDDKKLELIRRHVDGMATAEDHRELQEALRNDAALRRLFARYMNLDAALGNGRLAAGPANMAEPVGGRRPSKGWFAWRPLAAAAAGLVFGLFSASMVWAYAVPLTKGTIRQVVAVFADGFEDSQMTPRGGFPKRPNEWTGDLSAPVGVESGVTPIEGQRMLRLTPPPKRKFGYARRIVDLAEYPLLPERQTRRLEVTASFNTPGTERSSLYQIRLAAFSEEPGDLRAIWNDEPVLFDTVLQHVGRNVRTEPGESGWQTVSAVLDLPPGTRSIVISLAAAEADPAVPPTVHFLDDVQARFVITQASWN